MLFPEGDAVRASVADDELVLVRAVVQLDRGAQGEELRREAGAQGVCSTRAPLVFEAMV